MKRYAILLLVALFVLTACSQKDDERVGSTRPAEDFPVTCVNDTDCPLRVCDDGSEVTDKVCFGNVCKPLTFIRDPCEKI